jgi:RNA polymerase sigma factor (sigma-70 family)
MMSELPFQFPETDWRYVDRASRAATALRRRFGRGVPATDLVHQVILEALEERARTGLEPKGFWMRLINKVFDNYRRDQTHRRMLASRVVGLRIAERTAPRLGPGEAEAMGRELRERIEHVVAGMSVNDREIWRRLGGSESYREIAQALGKTPDAVKQAAYRIRAHVRDCLPSEYRREAAGDA